MKTFRYSHHGYTITITIEAPNNRRPMEDIAHEWAIQCGYSLSLFRSRLRSAPVAAARQNLYARLYNAGYNATEIGKFLNRNPDTIRYGNRKYTQRSIDSIHVAD